MSTWLLEPDVSGLIACFSGVLAGCASRKIVRIGSWSFQCLRSAGLVPDVEDKTPPEAPDPTAANRSPRGPLKWLAQTMAS